MIQKKATNSMFNSSVICRYFAYLVVFTMFFTTFGCKKEDPTIKYQSHVDSAKKYQEQDKLDEARIELQNAIDLKPKDAEAHYQMATVQLRLGKIPHAVESYNSAINYNPNHRDARLQLASIYVAANEFELAESHVSNLLEKDPTDTKALTIKANLEGLGPRKDSKKALEILKVIQNKEPENIIVIASRATYELIENNIETAEKLFKQALALQPDSGPIKMALADLYNRQGRMDEAQELIEGLVKENPDQSNLRYVFGEFLLKRGLGDKALEQYKSIIASDPKNIGARDRLYDIYLTRQQEELAKMLTDDLKKIDSKDPSVKYFTARNLELEGKEKEALAGFLDAITIINNFAPAFRRAGILEVAAGKLVEGVEHLNQALNLDADDAAARFALSRALFIKHEYTEAKENLEKILAKHPDHLAANVLRADLAIIDNEPAKAEKVYNYLLEAAPKNPIGYFKKAVLEERKGNTQEAIDWYLKTLDFDTNILPPARRLVELRREQKKSIGEIISELKSLSEKSKNSTAEYDLMMGTLVLADDNEPNKLEIARKLLLSAVEKNPKLIGAYFALATLDGADGNPKAAETNYTKLLKEDPQHIPSLMMLALTQEGQKNYDKASESYKKILDFAPEFGPAANNLAWLLAEEIKEGDLDEALRLAQIAKEQMPDEGSVSDTLGWVHVLKGSPIIAVEFLEEAVKQETAANSQNPVNPEIIYHLAKAYLDSGDKENAMKNINLALTNAGEDHPKLQKFKDLKNSIK